MEVIAIVEARDARAARRKAPKPYRKFLGEIIAEESASQVGQLLATK